MGDPVLVVLDDDADAPTPQDPAPSVRRRWWIAVLVAVALVLVAAQVVADARERARVTAVGRLPGVLAPQPDPPRVAWQVDDDTVDVVVVGRDLVEERIAADGAMTLTARDVATGAERWTVPVLGAPTVPLAEDTTRYGLQCADGPGLPGRLVCLAHDATSVSTPDGQGAGASTTRSAPATSATVVVVDLGDGEVRERHGADEGGAVAAALEVVGDQVVLAAPLDDGTTAWALDPATGAERWRVHAETGFGGGWLRWGAEVRVVPVGDEAVAVLGAGAVLLDASDGTATGSAGTLATVLGARPDGSALVVASEGYTRLMGPERDVRLDGGPIPVTVDDGSVPDLALTLSGGLRAWDAATGEMRWRARDVTGTQEALVLGGRVHAHDGYRVSTLDARTGEILWEVTAPELFSPDAAVAGLATDGVLLLVDGLDAPASRAELVAVDPGAGTVRWEADLPDVTSVGTIDGVLAARNPAGTVVLR
ncbi:outer membrane protein assembly factor BamB family protein [Cellulomonas wangsupingiae]|uniref:PQQ-like beta-propeller repeat protein n=1 Tax=Cellulomonas wangsupingiae TaxID=2968085 RepID=A0ABY5K427_9CELL|nr:PQQ-binding-like beta-propeller repeat protein [Cellulomonas wangsupingiae]MCC2333966.1 PQQ-like beta-propeller repeat protein [Cellulomonas wangsupingiae]UUI65221.1 PQQ-like beta-propeller repeat protein [Cellulomonas wangsupingiae]